MKISGPKLYLHIEGLVVLVAACSFSRFAYNQADTAAAWMIDDYFDEKEDPLSVPDTTDPEQLQVLLRVVACGCVWVMCGLCVFVS